MLRFNADVRVTLCWPSTAGARGAVFPGAVFVPHGAGEGGGDSGRDQTWHPSGQVHVLLHLLISRWGGAGGGHEEVKHARLQTKPVAKRRLTLGNDATICTHEAFRNTLFRTYSRFIHSVFNNDALLCAAGSVSHIWDSRTVTWRSWTGRMRLRGECLCTSYL